MSRNEREKVAELGFQVGKELARINEPIIARITTLSKLNDFTTDIYTRWGRTVARDYADKINRISYKIPYRDLWVYFLSDVRLGLVLESEELWKEWH